jgi:hypothetical protein
MVTHPDRILHFRALHVQQVNLPQQRTTQRTKGKNRQTKKSQDSCLRRKYSPSWFCSVMGFLV